MPKYIDADEYIKYCEENWIVLNVDAVNKQPAADVEPVRHGRTIEDKYLSYEIYVCSVCKAYYPKEMECFSKQHFKYCPNCGAKMSKENDNE